MNKEVLIKVKGIQGDLVDDEAIEMVTTGEYYEKGGKSYIRYEDATLMENEVVSTTIKCSPTQVSILRFGGNSTQMVFEKDHSHYTPYETPFGIFDIMLHTTDIRIDKEDDRMMVTVDYAIDINHSGTTPSQFVVEIENN